MVAPLRESPCMLQNRLIQYLVVTALLFGIADLALNFYTGTYGAIKMRADADKAKSDASIAAANAKAATGIVGGRYIPDDTKAPEADAARLAQLQKQKEIRGRLIACLESKKNDSQLGDCDAIQKEYDAAMAARPANRKWQRSLD